MSLYLDDGDVKLWHGDALDVLRTLPEHIAEIVGGALPSFDDAVRGIETRGRDVV